MRPLVEAAMASGVASVTATLCGFARVKLYALLLGVAGVGVMAQVQNLHNLLAVVAMMGLGIGLSREVARARASGNPDSVETVLRTARTLAGGASIVLVVAVMLLARTLSIWLLGTPEYAWLLRLAAPALWFFSMGRVLHEFLNGHRAYWATSTATVVGSVLGVAVLLPLILILKLSGAVAALPLATLVGWLVLLVVVRRRRPRPAPTPRGFCRDTASVLIGLGAATLAVATADQVALLLIRAQLIRWHGLSGNGWFQGVWGLSQYLLNVTVVFLSSYSVARISEMGPEVDTAPEIRRSLRMTLLLTVPMAVAMIVLREPLVRWLLSPEFLPAVPFFPYQAGGILCRAVGLALGIGLLARSPLGAWLVLGLSAPLTFLATFWWLAASRGVLAAPQAYLVSGGVYAAVSLMLTRRYLGLRLPARQVATVGSAGLLLAFLAWWAQPAWMSYLVGAALLAAWYGLAVRPSEVRSLWIQAREALQRRRQSRRPGDSR